MSAIKPNRAFKYSELWSLLKEDSDVEKQIFLQGLLEFLFNSIGVMTSLALTDAKLLFSGMQVIKLVPWEKSRLPYFVGKAAFPLQHLSNFFGMHNCMCCLRVKV